MAKVRGIDHIGIAVKNSAATREIFENLFGLKFSGEEVVESQGVKVMFCDLGGTKLELVEPTREDAAIAKYIEKRGEGIHHICFDVEGIEGMIADIKSKGGEVTNDPPRAGAHGRVVTFVPPKSASGVLVELSEKKK